MGCRFGNSIQALTNLYIWAKLKKLSVKFNKNICNELEFTDIDFSENKNPVKFEKKILSIYFTSKYKFNDEEKIRTMQSMYPLIKKEPIDFDPKSTLVIHIRSGDLFTQETQICDWYIQPPLSFYKKIINQAKKENILIITESDFLNPCITELKRLYPSAKIQSASLIKDINSILAAETLVIGKGTFGKHLALISKSLKDLYIFEQNPKGVDYINFATVDKSLIQFNLHLYNASNYINSWKNTPEQKKIMLTIPESEIRLIREELYKF